MSAPFPVVVFDFDPYLHLFGLSFRSETLLFAIAAFAAIVWAGLLAGRTPIGDGTTPAHVRVRPPRAAAADDDAEDDDQEDDDWDDEDDTPPDPNGMLRRDDLLFIILGTIPGAVLLGRLGYGLLHLDWYGPELRRLLDLTTGSGELTLAVLGGTLSGIWVAALLDAPVGRWLHVAIRPLLLALIIGKMGQVLGGSGQGAFVLDGSVPATSYAGSWAWGSLGPDIPAIPSQLYEAGITLVVLLVVGFVGAFTGLRHPDGRLFAVGLGLWAFSRGLIATTWRDAPVAGTLKAEQIICLSVAAIALSAAMAAWAWGRHARSSATRAPTPASPPAHEAATRT